MRRKHISFLQNNMKYFWQKIGMILLAVVFGCAQLEAAKEKNVPTVIKSWRLLHDYGLVDSVQMDTTYINLPMRNVINDYSIANAYNGNTVSPIQSKIYFDRDGNGMASGETRQKIDFLFGQAYSPFILTPADIRFYHTTVAYSGVGWQKGLTNGHQDSEVTFHFTGNLRQHTNVGMQLRYLNAPGHYSNQEAKLFNGAIFGTYNGRHYGLAATVTFNKLSNFENGGLKDAGELGGLLDAPDLPTNMYGMSGYNYISGYLNHHYSICTERERKISIKDRKNGTTRDSIVVEYVPVTTFAHTFAVTNSTKRYVEKTANQRFFENTFLNTRQTNDTAAALAIRNTIAATFEEEFNYKLKFGATVYVTNEFLRYQYRIGQSEPLISTEIGATSFDEIMQIGLHVMPDTLVGHKWTNNTFIGGSLYKNRGKWVHFGFDGDVCLAGYKIGEFQVNGHLDGDFRIGKDSMHISAQTYIKNETPDYFLQHYRSNHFIWDNDFSKTYRFFVGGDIAYPTKWVKPSLRIGFENLTHPIYFDRIGGPVQHDGNVQILEANLRLDLTTPWINLENHAVYQASTDSIIPVPAITLYHNLYYHGIWFKALYAQLGVDMRYHTKYYAPIYNPALGTFGAQHEVKIGNYPVMNAYINLYVKSLKLKLFAQLTHFNYYFMKQKKTYLSMPGYAENPATFRLGAAWHFWK